jgi:phosphoglycerate dehydrogenase-like enzyme
VSPRPVGVLVYHPDEVREYAALVRAPRGAVRVHAAATPAEAAAVLGEVEALFAWKFPPDLYAKAPRLRWVQAMGAGVDWLLDGALPPHLVVTRAPGVFGGWMAEYVLGWCAWVTQRMDLYRAAQRERRWRGDVIPERLAGKTLVVVGLGDIGRAIARAARGLGMRVRGVSRSGRPVPGVERVDRTGRLPAALAAADFAVLVLPLTPATRGLVGGEALAALRPHAWLINIGRGALVDEAALVDALRARRLGGAILDVFATEPLPPEHPLWDLDNAVITPHIAGPSTPAELTPIFNANLRRFLARRPLLHRVDRRLGY